MHIVYLIGPACAGKTTVGQTLKDHPYIHFEDLDEVMRIHLNTPDLGDYLREHGYDNFFLQGLYLIHTRMQTLVTDTTVFALGTGMYECFSRCLSLLCQSQSILITAPVETLFMRWKQKTQNSWLTIEAFEALHFRQERKQLYANAIHSINTSNQWSLDSYKSELIAFIEDYRNTYYTVLKDYGSPYADKSCKR